MLLDTHLLLLALGEPGRLDRGTRDLIADTGNEVLFSAASIWEIAIKTALGRFDFKVAPEAIVDGARRTGFTGLPVRPAAAALVASLPPLHRDPFDRLLVAQAMTEPARLYTADPMLPPYSELVSLVAS
ncbi:type II toxin-antitoxin system VapC family toxin [Lichenicoccus roseus]|nr:type II toxin-antitoxin system VapC family toxin [Lichenicoccus roseus]